jgi:hypothetical protein
MIRELKIWCQPGLLLHTYGAAFLRITIFRKCGLEGSASSCLSRELERDAIQAGLVRDWQHTNAKRNHGRRGLSEAGPHETRAVDWSEASSHRA